MSATRRAAALALLLGNAGQGLKGITSVCSAHPLVIEAACLRAAATGGPVLIEATCNQVNQDGGYTGMTPAAFRRFVEEIAERTGLPRDRLILGGDHLGPNPWTKLPAEEALAKAEVMIEAFVAAGFTKLHLDASMGCAGEPAALPDEIVARRAARLAHVAEQAVQQANGVPPVYVIGTEVPPPGGAREVIDTLELTTPGAAQRTLDIHRAAFADLGITDAFARVVAMVVQPGVEFGNANVVGYRPDAAQALSHALDDLPGLVFEAHSTDYQTPAALAALVADGFAILKVGPGLTFALREALYGLDAIAAVLNGPRQMPLPDVMERLMLAEPANWRGHYHGTPGEQRLQRHFSYSDRIRYYWTHPTAVAAVEALFAELSPAPLPETLISQYLGRLYPRVAAGEIAPTPRALCLAAIDAVLLPYAEATAGG